MGKRKSQNDMVFPQARLRFVQAHAGCIAHERVTVGFREALVVEPVAAFVQHGKDSSRQIILAHADGEPDVVSARKQRERMGRTVEPSALELEADHLKHPAAQLALTAVGEPRAARGLARRGFGRLLHQRHEAIADFVQHRVEARAAHVLLELVEERVISVAAGRKRGRPFADQSEQLLEGR
jgi:hypothetical protein